MLKIIALIHAIHSDKEKPSKLWTRGGCCPRWLEVEIEQHLVDAASGD
ncbi:MAG: hypothetical protein ACR2NK_03360 [Mariniblastus sp.]